MARHTSRWRREVSPQTTSLEKLGVRADQTRSPIVRGSVSAAQFAFPSFTTERTRPSFCLATKAFATRVHVSMPMATRLFRLKLFETETSTVSRYQSLIRLHA